MCASRSSARSPVRRSWRRIGAMLAAGGVLAGAASIASAATVTPTSKQLGAAALPVTITTVSLVAVADTYTDQSSPTTNFGTATTLSIQSATSANRRSFVRFDLSAIPTTARVQTATLQL